MRSVGHRVPLLSRPSARPAIYATGFVSLGLVPATALLVTLWSTVYLEAIGASSLVGGPAALLAGAATRRLGAASR